MKRINAIFSLFVLLLTGVTVASCQTQTNKNTTQVKQLSVEEFSEKIKNTTSIILDVRTPGEFSQGNIPNAINIDFNSGDFETQLQKLDPAKEYYVYCASGNRSGQATRLMAQKGFKNVYNMSDGGYSNWQRLNR